MLQTEKGEQDVLQTEKENKMKLWVKKEAAAAFAAAMFAVSFASANGDEYQFIVSGEIVAATTGCSLESSEATALESGPLADGVVCNSELEGRYRTMGGSNTCSLRSDKSGFIILVW